MSRDWPPITNRELLERQALPDAEFRSLMLAFVGALGRREATPELVEHALAYPWERPARSYVLRDAGVTLLEDVAPGEREGLIAQFAQDRHPVVAFGSNAAPVRLAKKLEHFEDAADRATLVLAGDLHGFDVGAAAAPTGYGSMPAAVFHSPGTAVRAAVLWLTTTQVEQLTWTELSYWLARLDTARFVPDEAAVEIPQVLAYVTRFGVFCPDGAPAAMTAIPARDRVAPARSQEQLLDAAAARILGPHTSARDLITAIFDDMSAVAKRAAETMWSDGVHLPAGSWTRFPAPELLVELGD